MQGFSLSCSPRFFLVRLDNWSLYLQNSQISVCRIMNSHVQGSWKFSTWDVGWSAASLGIPCGQLGWGLQGQLLARPENWPSLGVFWLTFIQFRPRHDRSIWQCPSTPWNQHSCSSSEEAWVLCAVGGNVLLFRCEGILLGYEEVTAMWLLS